MMPFQFFKFPAWFLFLLIITPGSFAFAQYAEGAWAAERLNNTRCEYDYRVDEVKPGGHAFLRETKTCSWPSSRRVVGGTSRELRRCEIDSIPRNSVGQCKNRNAAIAALQRSRNTHQEPNPWGESGPAEDSAVWVEQ